MNRIYNLMALQSDFLSNTGKIYSVVTGIVIIFLGIVFFLWKIDSKLNKLEKQIKHEHKTS
jgi:CcmD family protein